MQYILLWLVIILSAAQNIFHKQYSQKTEKPNVFLFLAVSAFTAFLFFVVSSGLRLTFTTEVFWYSLAFAISFMSAMIGMFLSIKWGALSISMLVISYSLVVPTLYGILFLKESLSVIRIVGLILLMISLFLIVDRSQKAVFSIRWLIALLCAFFGNGMCSTVQKAQQLAFDGGYKNEFMIVAFLVSAVLLFLFSCIRHEKWRGDPGIRFGAVNGVAIGIVNLMVLFLTGMIPNAILFPSVSAGGIVLGFVIARFMYKERLSPWQVGGYFIGTLSVIFLNL